MTKECPVCGKETYQEWEGEYDFYGDGKKISPDIGYCSSCGFNYQEHIKYSLEQQVKRYKKKPEEMK